MAEDVDKFLHDNRGGGRFPAATWDHPGQRWGGRVVGTPKVVETQFGTRLLIDLENSNYADGGVTWWVKPGPQAQALSDAVGGLGLAEGGLLEAVFTAEKDTGKGNPLKLFEATYEAPKPAVDVGSIFGTGGAPA